MTLEAHKPVLDPEEAHLAALHRLGGLDGRRVVELGCGGGRLTIVVALTSRPRGRRAPRCAVRERSRLRRLQAR
jgi:tRNA A58 N-methylase Trm61